MFCLEALLFQKNQISNQFFFSLLLEQSIEQWPQPIAKLVGYYTYQQILEFIIFSETTKSPYIALHVAAKPIFH